MTKGVLPLGVLVALAALGCSGCVGPSSAPSEINASSTLPEFVAGDPRDDLVRVSPDATHVAVGWPPQVIDAANLKLETHAGRWADSWCELYRVAGKASVWCPTRSIDDLVDLGDASAVLRDPTFGVALLPDGAEVYSLANGERVHSFPSATALVAVGAGAVAVRAESDILVWSGDAEIRLAGADAEIVDGNVRYVLLALDGDSVLVDRTSSAQVPIAGTVSLVADGRYVEIVESVVTVVDDDTRAQVCDTPPGLPTKAAGSLVQCGNVVLTVDGAEVVTAEDGAMFSSLVFSPTGNALYAQERFGSDIFDSRRVWRFADGSVVRRGAPTLLPRRPEPLFDRQELVSVVPEPPVDFASMDSEGREQTLVPGDDVQRWFIDGELFFVVGNHQLDVLNLIDRDRGRPNELDLADVFSAADGWVGLTSAGALLYAPSVTDAPIELAAGPFDKLHRPVAKLVVADVNEGERAGSWLLHVEP